MLPIIYHPNYSCPFPSGHRFVMSKFVDLYQHVLLQGLIADDKSNLYLPQAASLGDLSRVHDMAYLQKLCGNQVNLREWRRVGLPWSQALVDRTLTAPNGTLLTARLALQKGLACHLAGGTHHAHYDFGSGYCMINDLAYTAATLLENKEVQRILIFDLDVHQGDGTAAILKNQPNAFTCSIHCEKNFPFRKQPSDLDVGLAVGLEDDAYLKVVATTLNDVLDAFQPDLVLYDAGVDIWAQDDLGRLNISSQGMHDRDELVLTTCLKRHVPVATVIGGGYDTNVARLARRHAVVVEVAAHLYHQYF
jgi:acetoin utilization deacetylase AcuC-like enzyme